MTRRAEIAGAGFAGLAAAAALARRGWSVRVHEMADAPRSFGAGIYVFAFAQAVLRRIGAFDAFAAGAFEPPSKTIFVNGEARSTTASEGLYRTTTREILHRAVLDAALTAGVEIATSSRAVGAEAEGVLLMEDGSGLQADLIVAADGVRSGIAQHLGLPLHRTRHQDGITRVLLDRAELRGPAGDTIGDYYVYGPSNLRLLYSPCGADSFYFCLMAPATDAAATAVPIDTELWASAFPRMATAIRRIGTAGRHDRYTTTTMPRWSAGRVAVIGDAAHAMPSSLAQGAGVGMLNAVEMADAVADAADVQSGLAAWETAMRPIVEHWQRKSETVAEERNLSDAIHPGEDLAAERPEPLPLRILTETAS
jgi:2-methyl-3-hydroxypyridine 5-carboxylic acid dioxygenase